MQHISQIIIDMTRKQINLVYFRARAVFSREDMDKINQMIALVQEQDMMHRPIEPKIKMSQDDKQSFIDSVLSSEMYHHQIHVLGMAKAIDLGKAEQAKAMAIVNKYLNSI